jgi:hypothetical protein
MVSGSLFVNIPVCRELVRRQRPRRSLSRHPLFLAIPVLAWAVVFDWLGWALVLVGLGIAMSTAAGSMLVLGRTLWIMHPGNSSWRYEIDDAQIRVFNLRGLRAYDRRRFSVVDDLGAFWRISTPFGLASVVVPKAAFAPPDRTVVDAYLRGSPTVAA